MMSKKKLLRLMAISAFLPITAVAEDGHDHGRAAMAIVIEGGDVTVEFTSDLWNIVGFERAPSTPEEHEAIMRARGVLENDPAMIELNNQAECRRESVSSNFDTLFSDDTEHEDHDHHGHQELLVSYDFTCAKPGKVRTLTVGYFEEFSLLEKIDAIAITPDKQLWHVFRPGQNRMDLN